MKTLAAWMASALVTAAVGGAPAAFADACGDAGGFHPDAKFCRCQNGKVKVTVKIDPSQCRKVLVQLHTGAGITTTTIIGSRPGSVSTGAVPAPGVATVSAHVVCLPTNPPGACQRPHPNSDVWVPEGSSTYGEDGYLVTAEGVPNPNVPPCTDQKGC